MTKITLKTTLAFLIFAPLVTFVLLALKGLPSFAAGHEMDVLLYVYQGNWVSALIAGILFSLVLRAVQPRIGFFTEPYDVGRCISLGAIAGALVEAFSTWVYRVLTQHPFSSFWLASAIITGALLGAAIVPILFRKITVSLD